MMATKAITQAMTPAQANSVVPCPGVMPSEANATIVVSWLRLLAGPTWLSVCAIALLGSMPSRQ